MINVKENNKISARDLYNGLEIKSRFATWMERAIEDYGFTEGLDYFPTMGKTTSLGGRPTTEYDLTIDCAKELCLYGKSKKGKEYRKYLIGLSSQVDSHKLLNTKKAALAYKLINTFKFGEYQLEAENMHKESYRLSSRIKEDFHKLFANYRNDLLGINNRELKEGMIKAFESGMIHKVAAKNIRTRIMFLDRYQLIRNAVADYLICMGENTMDALNFADSVKEIAEFAQIEIRIKDEDTLFESKEYALPPSQIALKIANQ